MARRVINLSFERGTCTINAGFKDKTEENPLNGFSKLYTRVRGIMFELEALRNNTG